jgi:GDP-mannose 6-dehydrogenase
MKISVFGLGYVGAVTAGCLADRGHHVIGVDIHQQKVDTFDAGLSPIVEPGLVEMLGAAKRRGHLRATSDPDAALRASDLSIVCVGTPSLPSGEVDLQFVEHVAQELGLTLRSTGAPHTVVFRSTMVPGSTRRIVDRWLGDLHASGQLQVYCYPDFLREGSAISDFQSPSLAVIGTHDGSAPRSTIGAELSGGRAIEVSWESAEAIKHACNYFHALKIGFANEVGRICKSIGEDGTRVMAAVCSDTTLNISRNYLQPGNPFGGSCLTKDVAALSAYAQRSGVGTPLLDAPLCVERGASGAAARTGRAHWSSAHWPAWPGIQADHGRSARQCDGGARRVAAGAGLRSTDLRSAGERGATGRGQRRGDPSADAAPGCTAVRQCRSGR